MSLIPPKRLFHVPTMSTVMYEDVVDDVKNKGYVAISHVWGEQQMYSAEELDIENGTNWKIPLSNTTKIYRIIYAMIEHEMEYCWWDVLCMPQDKQNEINLEIPFMGDYYAGAVMTFVLGSIKYPISGNFKTWIEMDRKISEEKKLDQREHDWLISVAKKGEPLLNISDEIWFTRVWTMQEVVMSREVIICDTEGKYFNLTALLPLIENICCTDANLLELLFADTYLYDVCMTTFVYKSGTGDLVTTMHSIGNRKCYKLQDKFYGALGILGYKDIIVNYDINMENLNMDIVKHAYSKGDISWMSVYGEVNKGFIQPIYKKLPIIGSNWKEITKLITFEGDSMFVYSRSFAKICRYEKYNVESNNRCDIKVIRWITHTLISWGYNKKNMVEIITGFKREPEIVYEIVEKFLMSILICPDIFTIKDIGECFKEKYSLYDIARAEKALILVNIMHTYSYLVEAKLVETSKKIALIVFGNVCLGDEIKLLNIYNNGRILGVIVSETHERKALTYYRIDKQNAFYKPCRIIL